MCVCGWGQYTNNTLTHSVVLQVAADVQQVLVAAAGVDHQVDFRGGDLQGDVVCISP